MASGAQSTAVAEREAAEHETAEQETAADAQASLEAQSPTGTGRGLRPPAMSPWARAGLLTLGGVLIAIGVAGLVLPGIQGIVTIVAGLVVVSLGSHTAHRWTRRNLRRWPFALDKYERMRRTLRRRFNRRKRR